MINGTVYTDYCLPSLIKQYDELGMSITVRDEDAWNINYVMRHITDQYLDVVLINNLSPQSIVEIGIASLFCKKIVVTCNMDHVPKLKEMIDEFQPGCSLYQENTSFLTWFQYTIRSVHATLLQ